MSNWEDALAEPKVSRSNWEDALAPPKPRAAAKGIPQGFGYVRGSDVDAQPGATEMDRLKAYFAAGGAGHSMPPPGAAPAPAASLSTVGQIPGAAPGMVAPPAQQQWTNKPASMGDRIIGGLETAAALGTGATTGYASGLASLLDSAVRRGGYSLAGMDTSQIPSAEQAFTQGMAAGTYAPRTEEGRSQMQDVMGSEAMRALSAVAPLRQVQLAAVSVPVGMVARDVAGKVRGAGQTVAEQFSTREPMARVEPTLKPQYVMRDGKIVRKEAVSGADNVAVLGEQRTTAPAATRTAADVDLMAQPDREAVLSRVMPGQKVRKSVLAGDVNAAAGDVETARNAKSGDAGAALLKEAIDSERAGVQKFAEDTAALPGGMMGMDQGALQAKGAVLANPIDGAITWYQQATKKLYQDADAVAGGKPSSALPSTEKILGTDSNFSGKAENGALRRGITSYLREQNLIDGEGKHVPMTPLQAEGLRQYINSQRSAENRGMVGKLVRSIDNDVAEAAGPGIYGPARKMFGEQKDLFDNPNGISKLFSFDRDTPINRATAFEDIPGKFLSLSLDQQRHIVKVLREKMPTPELQAQANQALATLQSHVLESFATKGSSMASKWNQKAVSKALQDTSGTRKVLFEDRPDIMQRLEDLNAAGKMITAEDRSYGGASVQERTLISRGASALGKQIRTAGPAAAVALAVPSTGGLSAIAVPAAIGVGRRWQAAAEASQSLKDAKGRVKTLSDLGRP
jgi:hypothetical protein